MFSNSKKPQDKKVQKKKVAGWGSNADGQISWIQEAKEKAKKEAAAKVYYLIKNKKCNTYRNIKNCIVFKNIICLI